MEFDLARFRDVKDVDGFVATLEKACELALTDDFWDITLPNDLATSAARSPSLFAYQTSLVLLGATALFSKLSVAELPDPALQGQRSAAERHHLFPRAYLNGIGIKELRDTNQIANIALVEWGDNVGISDLPPSEYLPAMNKRFDESKLEEMYYWHALSDGWKSLEYSDFLGQRRERMAQVIRDAYKLLVSGEKDSIVASSPSIEELIHNGESAEVEYKSTLRMNLHTGSKDPRMELAILKTVAAFLNGGGGTLFVGIADDRSPLGLGADDFANEDKMGLHFVNLVKDRMGIQAMTSLHMHFEDYDGSRIMVVEADRAGKPVFVNDGNAARFYIRTGPSSFELVGGEMQDYIGQRFK